MTKNSALKLVPRENEGWRSGRPVEDPDKMKRWGFVTAKPSEHLVHVRRGKITNKSGQGASCFKWPWDSVSVIPTSLQRLQFRADQVKVGVEVVGLAVYRIADPLQAFRVLNFSYPERAQEKLEQTLTGMFVGGTRRIVATLSVEEVLRKRKAAVAEELLREIAPVVGGFGRSADSTDRGWGVVIDTIEIQEVRVLSEVVFASMQAPYRARLETEAREARAVADREIAQREAECRRETELAKLRTEDHLREQRAAHQRKQAEREMQIRIRQSELEAEQADAVSDAHEQRLRAQQKLAALERARADATAELERLRATVERDRGIALAEAALQTAEAAAKQADADARIEMVRKLPQVAEALGQAMSNANVTHIGSGDGPFAQIAAGVAAVMNMAQAND
jgi:regulator of protease activity HflC (stomatin/prohibitin superfamily)